MYFWPILPYVVGYLKNADRSPNAISSNRLSSFWIQMLELQKRAEIHDIKQAKSLLIQCMAQGQAKVMLENIKTII